MRERTGKVWLRKRWLEEKREQRKGETAQWFARFSYLDSDTGKRKVEKRCVDENDRPFQTKTDASDWLKRRLVEIQDELKRGPKPDDLSQKTFDELADLYEAEHLKEAVYVGEHKVDGLRGVYDQRLFLKTLRAHFGKRKVGSITKNSIQRFKADRLATPIVFKNKAGKVTGTRQRSIASVHRELALLRSMLYFALEEGWITANPFPRKSKLISTAQERKRERIVTREEEQRLLMACTDRSAHLRPILICAIDTGMRKGEILTLTWRNVDLQTGNITITARNAKTEKPRTLQMTERLKRALEALFELSTKNPDARTFGVFDNVKKSFNTVRKAAGLPDVRFHDLRHTCATRLVQSHMPIAEVARILGHTSIVTTYRYTNADKQTQQRAADLLNAFNEAPMTEAIN